jgi:hypothetical protein
VWLCDDDDVDVDDDDDDDDDDDAGARKVGRCQSILPCAARRRGYVAGPEQ